MNEIETYIAEMPENRRDKAAAMHDLITSLYPDAEISMKYKMPTYHREDNFLSWGNKKSYFSVYTCSAVRIEAFQKKHPKIPSGVGCLNFRDKDEFPVTDLKGVVANALAPGEDILEKERKIQEAAQRKRKKR